MHFSGLFAMGRRIIDYAFRPLDQAGIPNYNTAGNVTYLASDLLQPLILRDCNGASRTDTTPTAQQLLDALTVNGRPPVAGHCWRFFLRNTSGGAFTPTVTAGTGVTLSGTPGVAQSNCKEFLVVINTISPPAVTIYSLGTAIF